MNRYKDRLDQAERDLQRAHLDLAHPSVRTTKRIGLRIVSESDKPSWKEVRSEYAKLGFDSGIVMLSGRGTR